MRTCIFHDGALGDALLSLPCLRAIGASAGSTDWFGRGNVGELFQSAGLVSAVHDAGSSRFAQWHLPGPEDGALDLLGRYGRAFVFTVHPSSDLVQNVRSRVPDTTVIVTIPPDGSRAHAAAFRLGQLAGPRSQPEDVKLLPPAEARKRADDALAQAGRREGQELVVLHPGSGGRRKCWPLERYLDLAERISGRSSTFVLFLSGPAEEGEAERRIRQFAGGRPGVGCVADGSLPVLAGLLASADIYIGNDSGVTHLAAATGVPVLALFGPTDPAVWAPAGRNVGVVAAGTMEDISLETVLAAAEAALQGRTPEGARTGI